LFVRTRALNYKIARANNTAVNGGPQPLSQ